MFSRFHAPLGAILVILLGAGAAFAGKAVSSADMTAHEGPGDNYKVLWTIAAGSQVDIRKCDAFQWCFVKQRDKQGWVHVERIDSAPSRGGDGVGGPADGTSSTSIAELPGTPGGKSGGSNSGGGDGGAGSGEAYSVAGGETNSGGGSRQAPGTGGSSGFVRDTSGDAAKH